MTMFLNCSSTKTKNQLCVLHRNIVIDGDTSDWKGIHEETVNTSDHLWIGQGMEKKNWNGMKDLSFRWRVAYHENNLFFLFIVLDDTLCPFNRDHTWLNDCVELCIDPLNKGKNRFDIVDGQKKLNGYEMHFLPSPTPHAFMHDDTSLYFTSIPQDNEFIKHWNGNMAVKHFNGQYVLEITFSIPGIILHKGTTIGFETAVCDDDGHSRKSLLTWTRIQTDYWVSMDQYGKLIIH